MKNSLLTRSWIDEIILAYIAIEAKKLDQAYPDWIAEKNVAKIEVALVREFLDLGQVVK